jgi:hypothetical protein
MDDIIISPGSDAHVQPALPPIRPPLRDFRNFLRFAWEADGPAINQSERAIAPNSREDVAGERRQIAAMSLTVTLLLLLLGRTGIVPYIVERRDASTPILLLVWMLLLAYTLLAIEFAGTGGWARFKRWGVGTLVFTPVAGLLLVVADKGGMGWYVVAITVALLLFGAYLGWTLSKLHPIQWSQIWRWLSNISTATLISAAFVYFVGGTDERTKAMADSWTALYALCTSLMVGMFLSLRVGSFVGRALSPLFRARAS